MKALLLSLIFISTSSIAGNYLDENLRTLNWDGIEVVWLEDDSLPTFDVIFYFDKGSLGDSKGKEGTTELMFSELTSGTDALKQSEIVEGLEFYGLNYGSRVTHEFASFSMAGLKKNFNPSLKLVCQILTGANFPEKELKRSKRRILASIKNVVSDHSGLADHVFRIESMKGTGYEVPTTGYTSSIKEITSSDLKARLTEYNKSTHKKIYMRGGAHLKDLEKIVKNDCMWKQSPKVKKYPQVKNTAASKVYLVPVPNANQAQVRVGRIMTSQEVGTNKAELKSFSGKYLGGGFSSRLVQVLRVEKGLTYSAGAYVSEQKAYGRIGISTFTRNEKIVELLNSIKEITNTNSKKIDEEVFELSVKNVKGNYLLGLESSSDFLRNLLYFDHLGRKYEEIYEYSDEIDSITKKQLAKSIEDNFGFDKQVILILGHKDLQAPLKKGGYKVEVLNYKDYL